MPYHDTLICRLLSHKIGHSASVRVPSGKLLRIFTRHDPARGGIWSQVFQNLAGRVQPGTELIEISRVGSGRVGSGRVGSGRVGSGRIGSGRVGSCRVVSGRVGSCRVGSDRVGSGHPGPTRGARSDPARENPTHF